MKDIPPLLRPHLGDKSPVVIKKHLLEISENTNNLNISSANTVLIISGPSGAGKDSVIEKLPQGKFVRVRTCTTRTEIRPGETKNFPYVRLNKKDFQKNIEKDEFIEYAEYHGNFYGARRKEFFETMKRGLTPILRIDPQGGKYYMDLKKKRHKSLKDLLLVYFFITTPSVKDLKQRLLRRDVDIHQDDKKKRKAKKIVLARLKGVAADLALMSHAHYVVLNNEGQLYRAVSAIIKILEGLEKV